MHVNNLRKLFLELQVSQKIILSSIKCILYLFENNNTHWKLCFKRYNNNQLTRNTMATKPRMVRIIFNSDSFSTIQSVISEHLYTQNTGGKLRFGGNGAWMFRKNRLLKLNHKNICWLVHVVDNKSFVILFVEDYPFSLCCWRVFNIINYSSQCYVARTRHFSIGGLIKIWSFFYIKWQCDSSDLLIVGGITQIWLGVNGVMHSRINDRIVVRWNLDSKKVCKLSETRITNGL